MVTRRTLKTLVVIGTACVILASIWYPAIFDPIFHFFADWWREIATAIAVVSASLVVACIWFGKEGGIPSPACCTDVTDDCQKKKYDALPDPYPTTYREEDSITGFKCKSHLHILRLKQRPGRIGTDREAQYVVGKDYAVCYQLKGKSWQTISVPRGTLTDLASVPRLFRFIVGRVGPHLEASIIHDYLYVAWQVKNKSPTDAMRRFADDLYLAAMQEAGMGCKAHLIYRAVRFAGRCIFYGRNPEPWILCDEKLPACCISAENGPDRESRPSGNDV